MIQCLSYLSNVVVHVDPSGSAGEAFHRLSEYEHSSLPPNPTESSGLSGYNPEISAPVLSFG